MSATSSTDPDDVHHHYHQQQQQQSSSIVKFKVQSSSSKAVNDTTKSITGHQANEHQWNSLPLVALSNIFSCLDACHRLKASATCHSWRNVLFTSTLFPCRNFRVNLCSHKFTIPTGKVCKGNINTANKQMYGFRIFALRSRSQPYGSSSSSSSKRRANRGHKTFNNDHLKAFFQKCAPFLTGLTVYFDPNSTLNVIDLNEIIKFFSENEVPIYELNPSVKSTITFANCRNLRSIALVPITPLLRNSKGFTCLYYGLTEALRFLLSKSQKLEELCLGELDLLIAFADLFLEELSKSNREQAIRRLQISSIKGDVLRYMQPPPLPLAAFEKFTSLVSLSIDFDCLNSKAIKDFEHLVHLKSIQINVHRFSRHHQGTAIDGSSWTSLQRALPELSATINLLHTESESFAPLIESLIATDLPIRHFRAYFLELRDDQTQEQMCNLLDTLSLRHGKILETAAFVDHLCQPKRYLKFSVPNPWVMFAWRCSTLYNLTIIGLSLILISSINAQSTTNHR